MLNLSPGLNGMLFDARLITRQGLRDNRRLRRFGARTPIESVTYHVYASWTHREMSDRTSTDSLRVAEFALTELVARSDLERDGARQLMLTKVLKPESPSSNRDFAAGLPFRVYVRWPKQRTSDRTNTDSMSTAAYAFDDLVSRRDQLAGDGALAIVMSNGSERVEYVELAESAPRT